MSASLVGSEMCIRDRGGSVGLPKGVAQGRNVGRGGSLLTLLRHGLEGPVSYTHLTLPTICSV
eukprot:13244129-Alexandrium_andersonii.AAC.1